MPVTPMRKPKTKHQMIQRVYCRFIRKNRFKSVFNGKAMRKQIRTIKRQLRGYPRWQLVKIVKVLKFA